MLKLIQKVFLSEPSEFFTADSEWSDNILPANTVAYELTVGSEVGNKFALDESKDPFTIKATNNGTIIPLAISRHKVPVQSLHIHQDNKYNMPTIINILISVEEKNLDQWLDEVGTLAEELDEVSKLTQDLLSKVELMYGEAFDIEDYNLGDRILFLEKQTNDIYNSLIYNDTYLKEV